MLSPLDLASGVCFSSRPGSIVMYITFCGFMADSEIS